MRRTQTRSRKEQKTKSTLERRAARQKLVTKIVRFLGFPSSGIGIGVTIHLALKGDLKNAAIIGLVTFLVTIGAIAAKFISELFNSVLDKIEEKLEDKTEPLANWIVNSLENLLLKLWWTLTSDFKGKYYKQLEYTCRDYLTQGLDKDKILKLEKVFVPLKIATKDAKSVTSRMIQEVNNQAKNPKEKQIWDFLAAIRHEPGFKRMVILGAPGSGKTTLLRYIALTYATNTQKKIHRKAPKLIPILLYLREIRQDITNNKPPLADLITQQIKNQRNIEQLNPPPDWFRDRLRHHKCLVMLDGLDEVADTKQRQQVRDWVDEQIVQYPETCFVLTSRPYGYKSAPLKQAVTGLEVKPFSLKQMQQFLHNWYLQTEIMSRAGEDDLGVQEEALKQANDLIERICKSKSLADMAVNPLLLTMIATVHYRGNILPGKRVELYKEICQVLLEKRQRAKNIEDYLTASQKQSVLQKLALALMINRIREFELLYSILSPIRSQLERVTIKISLEVFIQQIKNVCGLIVEKELGIYEFAHLSFQEYLAAVEIKDSNQEKILINNLNDSWWHETIRLYVAQSDATNIILAALETPTIDTMALAYDCLDEGLSVDAEVRAELETMLEDDLENL
ncbi:MAG: NACHT domain-containing protein [Cyanobacteria bacterium P01_F01_bin.143]